MFYVSCNNNNIYICIYDYILCICNLNIIFFIIAFQYSSSNSVEKMDKENFDNCNTTNALQTFSNDNGNTTIPLTNPGGWYFTSGNRLYCLGGMKLQLDAITNNSIAPSPHSSPLAPQSPSASKTDKPTVSSTATQNDPQIHYLVSVATTLVYTNFVRLLHIWFI